VYVCGVYVCVCGVYVVCVRACLRLCMLVAVAGDIQAL
jgi:hypothetical protein